MSKAQQKVIDLLREGYTVTRDQSGESAPGCVAMSPRGSFWRVHPRTLDSLVRQGAIKAAVISPFCTRYTLNEEKQS